MNSIQQSDVALNRISGSSIAEVAKRGKKLPPQLGAEPPKTPRFSADTHIEPQNVKLAKKGNSELTGAGNKASAINREKIRQDMIASAVTQLNDYIQNEQRDIEFSMNDEAGLSVVKVVNRHSRELVRQIPTEEVVDLARKLNDQEPLRLFSAQV